MYANRQPCSMAPSQKSQSSSPRRIVTTYTLVLFPDRTTVEGGGMDEVPVQQFASVKRANTTVIGPGSEALRIPVDNTNLRVRVQDCDCTVYPTGSQAVVSIQGK